MNHDKSIVRWSVGDPARKNIRCIYDVMSLACLLGASLTYVESHTPNFMQYTAI